MMWIEVNLSVKNPEFAEEINEWRTLFNSELVNMISPTYYREVSCIEFVSGKNIGKFYPFTENNTRAIYNGFLLALQGQEVVFDEWGYIKPLLNERREELHKYMLYLQTINDLTTDVG